VGIARQGVVARVAVESQRGLGSAARVRAWDGFPWRAFATRITRHGGFVDSLRALDPKRVAVQDIEVSWAYNSPCPDYRDVVPVPKPKPKPGCTGRARSVSWSAVRDPRAEAQSGYVNDSPGTRVKRVAFDHPIVRRLVAGQAAFAIDSVAQWDKCNQDPLGAVISLRLVTPIAFEGDVPVLSFSDKDRVAYREGIAHIRVRNATAFDVYVDLNRAMVVAISPESGLYGSGQPAMHLDEFKLVSPLHPAGGPDSGKCESHD
jgi:hypothetical protein